MKTKFFVAAVLAVTAMFATADAAVKKPTKLGSGAQKWTVTGEVLKKKCNDECTKTTCDTRKPTGFKKAVECATNCRKDATFEIADCTPGAYAAKCGVYAKSDPVAAAKLAAHKAKGDEDCLVLAKANAAILMKVYENRDNKKSALGGGKMTAEESAATNAQASAFRTGEVPGSREAITWALLKSVDTGNDEAAAAPAEAAPAEAPPAE